MPFHRRGFLQATPAMFAGSLLCRAEDTPAVSLPGADGRGASRAPAARETVTIDVAGGDDLQRALNLHAGTGRCVRIGTPGSLTCTVREESVAGERSTHALLVPEGVRLDLNGATLRLDLRSNSYGVRLSSRSTVCNGTIRVARSEGKGSQACWHSGISVGAAYGNGGTPEKPGHFSTVSRWAIENVTIDQPFAAAAVALMSEACHGTIRGVRVLDSDKALLGIGMDWGSVGPVTAEDREQPRMRRLWEEGRLYTTHPHDILVEDLTVGRLTRNVDANDAGVRCSACHRITIRNVTVESAAAAVLLVGGDLGYEFAREDQRGDAHTGYLVDTVRIASAQIYGIALNGSADNIWRSRRNHGYTPVRDPVHPGLDRPVFRNIRLRGGSRPGAQGIYAVSLSGATLEDVEVAGFDIGVHVEDWVRGMHFRACKFAGNRRDVQVEGASEPAAGVVFDPPQKG